MSTNDLHTNNNGGWNNSTLLCIPILGTTVDEMHGLIFKAVDIGADVIELRLDYLSNFIPGKDLEVLVKLSPLPTIVTYRPVWQGGHYDGDETERLDTLRLAMELGADYIDVELKVADGFIDTIQEKKPENSKIIVSSHNFHYTPSVEDIGNLVAMMQAIGADIAKIVTTALDITDCARIFQISVHSQVPVIGIVMGERGLIAQTLSPKFGGYLTYGALDASETSCPVVPTAKDLLDLYNFRLIGPNTKIYGLIGKPVTQSKGALLYNAAFKSDEVNSVYLPFLVDDVEMYFNTYSSLDFAGWSCTFPHKELVLKYMDYIDPVAKRIGATNHIVRNSDGKLIAYNTDYIGAISTIEDALRGLNGANYPAGGSPLTSKLFVILGAGGAGKSLAYGAAEKGARIIVSDRAFERAKELAEKVGGDVISVAEIEYFHPEGGMVLANTTPVGMTPRVDETPIPKHSLKYYCLVFDAIYTPKDTRLLREAEESGAVTVSGTEMFTRQALEQYKGFTSLHAPEALFRELMNKHA